jgi:hypothetical protein
MCKEINGALLGYNKIPFIIYHYTQAHNINPRTKQNDSNIHVYKQPETCELDATSQRLASIILSALLCDFALILIFLVTVFMLCLYTRNLVPIATHTRELTSNHRWALVGSKDYLWFSTTIMADGGGIVNVQCDLFYGIFHVLLGVEVILVV